MRHLAHNLKRKKFIKHQEKKRKRLRPEELLFSVRTEDINKTNKKFEKLKLAEITCVVLASSGFCSGVLSSLEIRDSFFATVQLIICSTTTLMLLFAIYWRTICELKWEQAKMKHSNVDTLYSTNKYRILILELIINIVHPLYGMQWYECKNYNKVLEVEITYNIVSIISCIMMLRVYHLVRCLFALSKYRTGRFNRLCKIYGTVPDNWFTFKCMMKEIPVVVLMCMFILGLFIGSYALYVFEYPTRPYGGKDFTKFGNAMWCVIVTMATVGYGDYYPVTDAGRLFGFITCMWGVLTMSLTAVTFSNLLSLNQGESTSLKVLERLWFKEELRKKAAFVLTSAVRLALMTKKKKKDRVIEVQFVRFRFFLKDLHNFKNLKLKLYDFDSYSDRIEMKLLETIGFYEQANEFMDKNNEVLEYLHRNR